MTLVTHLLLLHSKKLRESREVSNSKAEMASPHIWEAFSWKDSLTKQTMKFFILLLHSGSFQHNVLVDLIFQFLSVWIINFFWCNFDTSIEANLISLHGLQIHQHNLLLLHGSPARPGCGQPTWPSISVDFDWKINLYSAVLHKKELHQ